MEEEHLGCEILALQCRFGLNTVVTLNKKNIKHTIFATHFSLMTSSS